MGLAKHNDYELVWKVDNCGTCSIMRWFSHLIIKVLESKQEKDLILKLNI